MVVCASKDFRAPNLGGWVQRRDLNVMIQYT